MINAKSLADILRSPLRAEAAKKAVNAYLDDVKNAFHEFIWKNPCTEGDSIALEINYASEAHCVIDKRNIFISHADDNGHLVSYIEANDNGDFDWDDYTDSTEFLDLICEELYKRGFSVKIDTRENVIVPLILFDVNYYAERSITAEGINAITLAEVLSEPRIAEAAKKTTETYLEETEADFKSAVESNPNLPYEVDAVAAVIRYISSKENVIKMNGPLSLDHENLRKFIQNNYMWKDVKIGSHKIDWRIFSDSEFYLQQVITTLEERGLEVWFDEANKRIVPLVFISRDYSDLNSTD